MNPQQFLNKIAPLLAELEQQIEPFAAQRKREILEAEERYQAALSRVPQVVREVRKWDHPNGRLIESYALKWQREDADAALSKEYTLIDIRYEEQVALLYTQHQKRVDELLCTVSS